MIVHRSLLNVVFVVLVLLLVFFSVLVGRYSVALDDRVVFTGGVSGSGSMEPLLYDDSKYLYRDFDGAVDVPLCGHVYVYERNDSLVIHRFVYEQSDGRLIFKGDNNQYTDDPVSKDSLVREVVGVRWD